MSDPLDGDDAVLLTKGVLSTVYAYDDAGKPAGRHGRYGLGHVAPFDHDDHRTPGEVPALFREESILGPSVVVESSEGSFHTWNLAVRTHPKTAVVLSRGDDDTKHEGVGRRRGYWRLRAGPKLTRNDDVFKPAPEVAATFLVTDDDGGGPDVSAPHAELLGKLFGPSVDAAVLDYLEATGAEAVGDALETVAYTTFSDTGKLLQRRSRAPREA